MVAMKHYEKQTDPPGFGRDEDKPVEYKQGDKVRTPDGIGFVHQTGIESKGVPVRVVLAEETGMVIAYLHNQVELIARTSEEPPAGKTVSFAIYGKPSDYYLELKTVSPGWQMIDAAKSLETALAAAAGYKFGPFWAEVNVGKYTVEIYEING